MEVIDYGVLYDYLFIMYYLWIVFFKNGKMILEFIRLLNGKMLYIKFSDDDVL